MVNGVVRHELDHQVEISQVRIFNAQMERSLLVKVSEDWNFEFYYGHVFRVWMRLIEEHLKENRIVKVLMEDCVTSRQNVVAEQLKLIRVDVRRNQNIINQVFNDSPLKEGETLLSHNSVFPFT